MFVITDEHYDFLMRIIVPAMKICELDDSKTDPTREPKKEIRKHCHLALKEFENNNLEAAHVHLSLAESINYLALGNVGEPVCENVTKHSRENSAPHKTVLADEAKAIAENSTASPRSSHKPIVQPSNNSHSSTTPASSSTYQFSVLNSKESIAFSILSNNIQTNERKLLHASRRTEKAANLLSKAHVAFAAKDYRVAEQLVLKAQNLRPNDKTSLSLEKIRAARKESEARISAEECKHKAEEAMSRGDFKDAERLLLEAAALSPLVDVKHILTEVRDMIKAEESSSRGRQSGAYTKTLKDLVDSEEAVQRWLSKAKKALDRGDFKRVEECATRAQSIKPSRRGEELLRRAQELKLEPPQTSQLESPKASQLEPPKASQLEPTQENTQKTERNTERQDAMRRIMAATDDYGRLGESCLVTHLSI